VVGQAGTGAKRLKFSCKSDIVRRPELLKLSCKSMIVHGPE